MINFLLGAPKKQLRGFTIIEMMVSLALFTIVITIAAGAFLSLIGASSQLQSEQTVMSSLTFAMDSMTREIRTGSSYYCADGVDNQMDTTETKDCKGGNTSISFVEAGSNPSRRISYSFTNTADNKNMLERQQDTNPPESILSSDTTLVSARFFVTGASTLSDNNDINQPMVTIVIQAQDPNDTNGKIYTLETTVDQRQLDI